MPHLPLSRLLGIQMKIFVIHKLRESIYAPYLLAANMADAFSEFQGVFLTNENTLEVLLCHNPIQMRLLQVIGEVDSPSFLSMSQATQRQ